jgi:septum formation protein
LSVPNPRLILASASPRRRELLHAAGYDFEVHPSDIDEDDYPASILPADLALRLAQLKANAGADRFPDDIVLAADTVVAFGDRPLGKPAGDFDATRMLELLSGTTHIVITGIAIVAKSRNIARSDRVMSAVRMKLLNGDEIKRYVESGDWRGKAGGYGIQDEREDPFVTRMAGSHTNIVGLPMEKTTQLLASVGIEPTNKAQ